MVSNLSKLFSILVLGSLGALTIAEPFSAFPQKDVNDRGLTSGSYNSLLAPHIYNVSAGAAWVFPSSANDLGARGMSCECFNPNETCCMAKSSSIAPFCIPQNATCCADTYCPGGEKCCGDACCPSETNCSANLNYTGCCPFNTTCSGAPICLDQSTSQCSDTYFPAQQCCPTDTPFCRSFAPYGTGCFASSTVQAVFGYQLATSIEIVTLFVSELGSGQYTLEPPVIPTKNVTSPLVVVTSIEIDVLPTPNSTSTSSTTSTYPHGISVGPTPSTSTVSTLCFNTDVEKDLPCPTPTPTSTSRESSSPPGYSPSGASVVHSQASSSISRVWYSLDWWTLISFVVFLLFMKFSRNIVRAYTQGLDGNSTAGYGPGMEVGMMEGKERRKHIRVVSGSARPLSGSFERDLALRQL